jgi:hypothetical protein
MGVAHEAYEAIGGWLGAEQWGLSDVGPSEGSPSDWVRANGFERRGPSDGVRATGSEQRWGSERSRSEQWESSAMGVRARLGSERDPFGVQATGSERSWVLGGPSGQGLSDGARWRRSR